MLYQTLIIINPISGRKHFAKAKQLIETTLDKSKFNFEIAYTRHHGHAYELGKEAIQSNIDIVIVVGGDGTINEVARALQGSKIKIGIIPVGSGNGLARELNIPIKVKQAITIINNIKRKKIDVISLGDNISVNVAGLGFDAYIAYLFNDLSKRGIWSYVKLTISEYFKYKPNKYKLYYNETKVKTKAFLIAIANTRQFGNNTFIAPQAINDDGLMDICILKPFPLLLAPLIALRLFNNTIHHSRYYESFKTDHIIIKSKKLTKGHTDGEVFELHKSIEATINKQAINVIIP